MGGRDRWSVGLILAWGCGGGDTGASSATEGSDTAGSGTASATANATNTTEADATTADEASASGSSATATGSTTEESTSAATTGDASTGSTTRDETSTGAEDSTSPSTGTTTDRSTTERSTSESSTSDGSTSDGSTSDGSTSDSSTSDSSTSDGSTSDSSTSDGSTTTTGEATTGGICSNAETSSSDGSSGGSETAGDPCGNGVLDPGEDCDDGNQIGGDGCEADCTDSDDVAPEWTLELGGPNGFPDCGTGVAFDCDGNLIVAAHTAPDVLWIRKYDPQYAELWTVTYPGPSLSCPLVRVATDADGNVGFIGTTPGSFPDLFFGVLDPDGVEIWTDIGTGIADYAIAGDVAFDGEGDLVVTGSPLDAVTSNDIWTAKYDPFGSLLWSDLYDGPISGGDAAWGIAVDAAGDVLVTGQARSLADNPDIVVRKYDGDTGVPQWTDLVAGAADGADVGRGVAVMPGGNVFAAGYISNLPFSSDAWLRHYQSDGTPIWTQTYTGTAAGNDALLDVAVDSAGTVVVAGVVGDVAGQRYWVARLTTDGGIIWERRRDEVGSWQAVAIAPDGRIAVAGASVYAFPYDWEARFAVYPP